MISSETTNVFTLLRLKLKLGLGLVSLRAAEGGERFGSVRFPQIGVGACG